MLLKTKTGIILIIEWKDGLKIEGKLETCYETDNGLEIEDKNYIEYYACAFKINKIIKSVGLENQNIEKNGLIEISIHNLPEKVFSKNGDILWKTKIS